MRHVILVLGLLLVTNAINAWAHGAHAHHGKPTEGTIAAVDGEHLTLTMDAGPVAVTLTETTHIAEGEKEVDRNALAPAVHVSVFGTKLASGELVAEDIHVEDAGAPTEREHPTH
jgi:hypothetical protein